jgi:hypothetical protein
MIDSTLDNTSTSGTEWGSGDKVGKGRAGSTGADAVVVKHCRAEIALALFAAIGS